MGTLARIRPILQRSSPAAGGVSAPLGQPADAAGAANAPPRLGELLVDQGVISRRQLSAALARQRRTGRPLGVELVEAGSVGPHELRAALAIQRKLRATALCSALLVASAHAPIVHADGGRASLGVRCVVPPRVQASVVYQATHLAVSRADVERGYVDAPSASKLSIRMNGAIGYSVRFNPRVPIFRSVQVRDSGAGGDIGPDGGTLIERKHGARELPAEISYRFVLDASVRPGMYPWPLALTVRPLDQ